MFTLNFIKNNDNLHTENKVQDKNGQTNGTMDRRRTDGLVVQLVKVITPKVIH